MLSRNPILIGVALALTPLTAHANLLTNGNFDLQDARIGVVNGHALNDLATSSPAWDVFDALPDGSGGESWTSPITNANAGIELQSSGVVVPAHSGQFYVELDADRGRNDFATNSAMRQSLTLGQGAYELSFWYRPRTNNGNSDNRIDLSVSNGDAETMTVDFVTGEFDEWREFSMEFVVDAVDAGSLYTVEFAAAGLENSLGGFIDTVRLQAVPVPATIGLLGTGLLSLTLLAARRRGAKGPAG